MADYSFDGKRLIKKSSGQKLAEVDRDNIRSYNGAIFGQVQGKNLRDNHGKKVAEFDGKDVKDDKGKKISLVPLGQAIGAACRFLPPTRGLLLTCSRPRSSPSRAPLPGLRPVFPARYPRLRQTGVSSDPWRLRALRSPGQRPRKGFPGA